MLIGLFILSGCAQKGGRNDIDDTAKYVNPVINKYLADPCIVFDSGYYYMFATGEAGDGRFIPIHRTKDFVSWEFVRGAVSQGNRHEWNHKHFWAPEVIRVGKKYYLYYTASPEYSPRNSGNRVGLAVASSIEGPYEDRGIVIPHASIDGHPFFDRDSTMYIFYTIEHLNSDSLKAGQIYMDKLVTPEKVEGRPKQILHHHIWQEGPVVQYRNERYFLTYSVGAWGEDTYHVRYAIAPSVSGPYVEQPDTILQSNEIVKGPGHHFMYKDREGRDWIVYHGWDTLFTARYPRIDRIFFTDDNRIMSDGPTYTPQSVNR